MKQYEAVIKIMEQNGGFATLGYLNQEVLKVPNVEWRTKTPFASIRRIVQDERFFFKIRPGLWALEAYKNRLPIEILPRGEVSPTEKLYFDHSYYQGLLLEIGNLKGYETAIPPQDKNKKYLNKTLGEISRVKEFYRFSYEHLVRKTQTIDVVWFNERKMPNSFFEIEHSTNMQNSLLKFFDLQDFSVRFFIVADKVRQREFESRIKFSAFTTLANRVRFVNYDKISDWHSKIYESVNLEKEILY